ncbi:multicomponent Na+:H+ antiporter subunit A [Leucobacter exalbidus]|uniref:Multicomponent Na+:H+ antiporter subunit A n=1 Tax=Leucobacter exalbidus TaxID=662960 RepID=A0A940PUL6_9MICO|nr:Na+/H+ antiporter subunit A [Leucobacter exalbidus]MBP1325584.1 multicomponent Na+:H+ antiporter subunit A [Leucobacter exalbidus]
MGAMTSMLLVVALCALCIHPVVTRVGPRAFLLLATLMAGIFAWVLALSIPVFNGDVLTESYQWVPQLSMTLGLRLDAVSAIFALLVTGAGSLVLLYCAYYFEAGEAGLARFAAVFMGFTASMLGLVLSDDVYLLFIFWEATTVFSFLLIGHVTRLRTANAAALQALMVTTFGGLAMLVGLVLLVQQTGTSSLVGIVEAAPTGAVATTAVFLVLVGALSKSAIFPFHFWLPGAMSAPTPVSAYLHAAAMVKAGVYMIARLAPGFADVPGFRVTLVTLGAITMIGGGIRALRQYDIKLLVAHGTVSQLGLLVMVIGVGTPATTFAGITLLITHAVAKAPLFLTVGVIDHATGTRDLRELSGLGKSLPGLTIIASIAVASMAGLPPFIGFVAKEAAFTELLDDGPLAVTAFWVALAGSILTVAYMGRFLWGAFFTKRGVPSSLILHAPPRGIYIAPAIFATVALLFGFISPLLDRLLRTGWPSNAEHLALWHGWTPALAASAVAIGAGTLLSLVLARRGRPLPAPPERFTASHIYWVLTQWLDTLAVRTTSITQRGSLPFYLAVILIVASCTIGGVAIWGGAWPNEYQWISSPVEIPIAILMITAACFALRARTRFQAVVLVGVTGYGMAALFATHGAPDLALTQALVETVTMIAFVLVIRRLSQRLNITVRRPARWARAAIGIATGLALGAATLIALGARVADPISLELPDLAYFGGHGSNVVNVMLVDIRGWDTLGELSVILAAATGVASLVFLNTRADLRPKITRREAQGFARDNLRRVADPNDPARRTPWLLAGRTLDPANRSILLEVVVRLLFHGLIILSIYLLLSGHNGPGGGFAGGLVAGLALVARYLAGGRYELSTTVPLDAGRILGAGLALAVTMAIVPMFFGQAALASSWIDVDLGWFGSIPLVTSTLFDIGVYLVVFGLVLDVLRSLGAEIDEHEEQDNAERTEEAMAK